MRACSVEGCDRPHMARGWCNAHYNRWYRNGDLEDHPTGRPLEDPVVRFWRYVTPAGAEECWPWRGNRNPNGYGLLPVHGERESGAHRFSYRLHVGPIPEGMWLDHLCRNRACVNPSHLEVTTPRENILRGENPCARNARKTHCPQGHPYAGDNLLVGTSPKGKYRTCKTCSHARSAAWRAARKAERAGR